MAWYEDCATPEEGYLALFDVLGSQARLRSQPLESTVIELKLLRSTVNLAAYHAQIGPPQAEPLGFLAFSDSVLVWPHSNGIDALANLIQRTEFLLRRSTEQGTLLRGAITKGELFVSEDRRIVTGNGLARAHCLERQQKWSGAIIDSEKIGNTNEEQLLLDDLSAAAWLRHHLVPGLTESGPVLCVDWASRCPWPLESLRMTHASVNMPPDEEARLRQEATFDFFEGRRPAMAEVEDYTDDEQVVSVMGGRILPCACRV